MLTEKKLNGVYYTPELLAREMIDWLITDKYSTFFDPCFGKSIFLKKAYEKYKKIGVENPYHQMYGVDIDPEMLIFLEKNMKNGNHFLTIDFLELRPEDMKGVPYTSICCNPPFVRHHNLTKDKLDVAISALETLGINISKKSSYWLYFLFHCTSFLEKSGRLAIIVPSSFLFSNYSKSIRPFFFNLFKEIIIISA